MIIVDRPTDAERDAVHEFVKANASGWWHHFSDAWIVGGRDPKFWRAKIKAILSEPSSSVLVLALPDDPDQRSWALYGSSASKKGQWLHENYGP